MTKEENINPLPFRLHLMKVKLLKSLKDFEISFEEQSVLDRLQAINEELQDKSLDLPKEEILKKQECFTGYYENAVNRSRKNVTAILGPNGHGKSTILHALASCFQPVTKVGEDYRFNQFFPSYNGNPWGEMVLEIVYSYRDRNQQVVNYHCQSYLRKDPSSNKEVRWPIANRRATRDVIYFGMDKCIPLIELEAQKKTSGQTKDWTVEPIEDSELLQLMGECLNKNYYSLLLYKTKDGKEFIGVSQRGLNYSALTMSGGEQKIYHLLRKILEAKKYSLVLIDELDLLLHDLAFKKLLKIVCQKAQEKCLQVIFTTHREIVTDFADLINIRHICNDNDVDKTICFDDTTPFLIERLTGSREKSLEIFVEDDLAAIIVKQVARNLGVSRDVSVIQVGSASNLFTALAGLVFKNDGKVENLSNNSLFLADGDVYRDEKSIEAQVKKIISGNDQRAKKIRQEILSSRIFRSLNLPKRSQFPDYRCSDKEYLSPEEFIHYLIVNVDILNSQDPEIIQLAKSIRSRSNSHDYIDEIVEKIDSGNRLTALNRIIEISFRSDHELIEEYVKDLKNWLQERKKVLKLG